MLIELSDDHRSSLCDISESCTRRSLHHRIIKKPLYSMPTLNHTDLARDLGPICRGFFSISFNKFNDKNGQVLLYIMSYPILSDFFIYLFTMITLAAGQTMPVLPPLSPLYMPSLFPFHNHSIVRRVTPSQDEVIWVFLMQIVDLLAV